MEVNPVYNEYIRWRNKPSFHQEPHKTLIDLENEKLEKYWDVDNSMEIAKQRNIKEQQNMPKSTAKSAIKTVKIRRQLDEGIQLNYDDVISTLKSNSPYIRKNYQRLEPHIKEEMQSKFGIFVDFQQ